MRWKIKYDTSKLIKKDIKSLKKDLVAIKKIKNVLNQLSENPFPKILDIKKLQPKSKEQYRVKINHWRIVFSIDFGNKIILIYRIALRKDIYK